MKKKTLKLSNWYSNPQPCSSMPPTDGPNELPARHGHGTIAHITETKPRKASH